MHKPRYIRLGKDRVSLLNPPNEGIVDTPTHAWKIGRSGDGMIVLRGNGCVHPDFAQGGMSMLQFCEWINAQ